MRLETLFIISLLSSCNSYNKSNEILIVEQDNTPVTYEVDSTETHYNQHLDSNNELKNSTKKIKEIVSIIDKTNYDSIITKKLDPEMRFSLRSETSINEKIALKAFFKDNVLKKIYVTETCNYSDDNHLLEEVVSEYYFDKDALVYTSESCQTINEENKQIQIASNFELYWEEEKIIDWMSLGMTRLEGDNGDNKLEKEYLENTKYYKRQANLSLH